MQKAIVAFDLAGQHLDVGLVERRFGQRLVALLAKRGAIVHVGERTVAVVDGALNVAGRRVVGLVAAVDDAHGQSQVFVHLRRAQRKVQCSPACG